MKNLKLVLLFIVTIVSCKNVDFKKVPATTNQGFDSKIDAIHTEVIKMELDSLTTPKLAAIQHYSDGNKEYLVYLNEETGTLYINDLTTKKIVKKIQVQDSLKSHNKLFQGFYYHSKDSIFMISFKPKVLLINESGTPLREFTLTGTNSPNQTSALFFKGLWASTSLQPFVFNDTLYLGSVVVGGADKQRKQIQIRLSLENGTVSAGKVVFPEIYSKYNFGANNYEIYSACANPKAPLLVYGFPQDENVIICSLKENQIYTKPAQSKYIREFTLYDKKNYGDAKSDPTLEYFMTTPSYEGIYYDQYRDLYYRMALLPTGLTNANYEEKNSLYKQLSIIVFDKNFNYLGETLLEKNKYQMFSAFVSSAGFNVQNRTGSDETLDFTTFSFSFSK